MSSSVAKLAEAINGLSIGLYKKLAQNEGNVFFSPFSISTALSMLLSGAREHTEEEMREVLHFDRVNITTSQVHSSYDQLLSVFGKSSDNITLKFANAILTQKDMPVSPEFQETIRNSYRGLLMDVDFTTEAEKAVLQINNWVKENTNEMIEKIVDSLDPATVMVILNAIYFKGSWKYPFDPDNTQPRLFYNGGQSDQRKDVPMMFIDKRFRFAEKPTFKALELPYENESESIVMLLLLPNQLDGLGSLENTLSIEILKDTMSSLHSCKIDVSLPKFRIEYSTELSDTLSELGMVSAFQDSANFSGINCNKICVSQVITKSVLVVNEEGSEAAAVTAVAVMLCSMAFNEKFEADHPFLCIIYDKEKDIILFIGRVKEF